MAKRKTTPRVRTIPSYLDRLLDKPRRELMNASGILECMLETERANPPGQDEPYMEGALEATRRIVMDALAALDSVALAQRIPDAAP